MSKNVFNTVPMREPQGSTFDLSHDVKFSAEMGKLVPIFCEEALPNDTFKLQTELMLRFAPLVAPVMHKVNVFVHYFFVPNRLLWTNWEKFINNNEGAPNPPSPPYLRIGTAPNYILNVAEASLADYLGVPTGFNFNSEEAKISALPFAAYQKIYTDYYRDENLIPAINPALVDGANGYNATFSTLRSRAWQHDYFTSSLPFAQKGGAVTIPLNAQSYIPVMRHTAAVSPPPTAAWSNVSPASTQTHAANSPNGGAGIEGQLFVDGANIIGQSTINDFRNALRLQEFLERMARGGSRYTEVLLAHFGQHSSDKRLQRPEFLGGSKQPVVISEVLQTSETADTPQATMAGHALSAGSGKYIKYHCEEHGWIIGIMSVLPRTAYQQGLHKKFSRRSVLDYAWPSFAHIGEQPVLNQEVYLDNVWSADSLGNRGTFGYVPRYSEYRYVPSRVAGAFRSSLAFWHLGRIFGSRPGLNQAFIECVPRTDIFAVSGQTQYLWCHAFNHCRAYRKLPAYGVPTL